MLLYNENFGNRFLNKDKNGADNRSRTCTEFLQQGPKPCASTNSAISAYEKKLALKNDPQILTAIIRKYNTVL